MNGIKQIQPDPLVTLICSDCKCVVAEGTREQLTMYIGYCPDCMRKRDDDLGYCFVCGAKGTLTYFDSVREIACSGCKMAVRDTTRTKTKEEFIEFYRSGYGWFKVNDTT